jgi:hypothetical protein
MENYDISMIVQPPELKLDLYPHQLASVFKMETLEREKKIKTNDVITETVIGINADITGYGKTLAMVTLIMRDRMDWDLDEPFITESIETFAANRIVKRNLSYFNKNNTTLILVSQSIVQQWLKELKYTDLTVKAITTRKDANTVDADEYDVIIVTPTMYNRFVERFHSICWKRFIFDEPGHIRVPAMRRINSGFMWLVTATPDSIIAQHRNCRSSFMYDIVNRNRWYAVENVFGSITIKNPDEFVKQSFEMPPTHHNYYNCYSPLYHTLNGIVNDRIINMINANNIDGVINALGGGDKTSNITELVRNKKLEELEEINAKIRIYTTRGDEDRLKHWTERKERVDAQLAELDKRFQDLLTKECNICYDKLQSPVMEPGCQNIFCAKCLMTWLKDKTTCPLCRQKVDTQQLIYITRDEDTKKEDKPKPLTKEKTIIDIIRKNKKGKFIVYSAHDETFGTIKRLFKENAISYVEVKGRIDTMARKIKKFKKGKIQVIFLNSKFNGAGIDLIEASDLIVYHKMSDDTLQQILGRPNRIGRTESLQVHHLIYK